MGNIETHNSSELFFPVCVYYRPDLSQSRDEAFTRVAWIVNKEEVVISIEIIAKLYNDYPEFVRIACGSYDILTNDCNEYEWYDVTNHIEISDLCQTVANLTDLTGKVPVCIFDAIYWPRFFTKQRKFFPNSLKKILFAWLLCCKRLPLYKDLRYKICDYIVENWKMLSN